MQQADTVGPSRRPPRRGRKVTKGISGTVSSVLGNSQCADEHGDNPCKGPEDRKGLAATYQQRFGIEPHSAATYVQDWKPLVQQRGDGIADQCNRHECQEDLIGGRRPDTVALAIGKDIDASHEEQSGTEVDRERYGDVTQEIAPTTDPGSDVTAPWRRKHIRLIIDATSSRIHGCDFTE